MGRAYEVRKASIQKTGAARGKIYTTFAKEIYLAAKKGIPDPDSNIVLKRIIEKLHFYDIFVIECNFANIYFFIYYYKRLCKLFQVFFIRFFKFYKHFWK